MSELDPIIDKLDAIPEPVRAFYAKDEASGLFRLKVKEKDGYALDNIAGLRSTLQDQKQKHDKAQAALKAFEGLDAAQAREALEMLKNGKLKSDDAVAAVRKEFEAKLAEKDGILTKMQQEQRQRLLSGTVSEAVSTRAEVPANLRAIVGDIFSSYIGVNDAGQVGVWNADKTAFRLTGKGSDYGAAMTPQEFIDSAIAAAVAGKKFDGLSPAHAAALPELIRAQGKAGGSGASGSAGGSGAYSRDAFLALNATQKAMAIKSNPQLAEYLK